MLIQSQECCGGEENKVPHILSEVNNIDNAVARDHPYNQSVPVISQSAD